MDEAQSLHKELAELNTQLDRVGGIRFSTREAPKAKSLLELPPELPLVYPQQLDLTDLVKLGDTSALADERSPARSTAILADLQTQLNAAYDVLQDVIDVRTRAVATYDDRLKSIVSSAIAIVSLAPEAKPIDLQLPAPDTKPQTRLATV